MARFERHFTLVEANALLPWVRSVFAAVHRILAELNKRSDTEDFEHAEDGGNGKPRPGSTTPPAAGANASLAAEWGVFGVNPEGVGPLPDLETLGRREKLNLANGLLAAIGDKGIVVQDLDRGLIDFPAWREGEEVLLCYELSDGPSIGYWHDLDSGFAGRRPLDEGFQGGGEASS